MKRQKPKAKRRKGKMQSRKMGRSSCAAKPQHLLGWTLRRRNGVWVLVRARLELQLAWFGDL